MRVKAIEIKVLDELDNTIISRVKVKPGIRFFELADMFDLPPTTVYNRIKSLIRTGHIRAERGKRSLTLYPVKLEGGPANDR